MTDLLGKAAGGARPVPGPSGEIARLMLASVGDEGSIYRSPPEAAADQDEADAEGARGESAPMRRWMPSGRGMGSESLSDSRPPILALIPRRRAAASEESSGQRSGGLLGMRARMGDPEFGPRPGPIRKPSGLGVRLPSRDQVRGHRPHARAGDGTPQCTAGRSAPLRTAL